MNFKKKPKRSYRDPTHTASITIRVTEEQKEKFKRHAENNNMTMSAIFRNLLEYLVVGLEE